ncbi:sensor histidine kinase [Brevibacterium litoralis]|uniref:sensor histidine kinase n=1 Tax=Brevibacterium litoralis TaxID=3138935 RepID=UPI0032EE743D
MTVTILVLIGAGIGTGAVVAVRSTLMHGLDADLDSLVEDADRDGPGRPTGVGSGGAFGGGPSPDSRLEFLTRPGQEDGSIAVVSDGSTVTGVVVRRALGEVENLPEDTVLSLLDVPVGAEPTTREIEGQGAYRLVATQPTGTDLVVVYGVPQDDVDHALRTTVWSTVAVVAVGVVLAALGAGALINRQLRPLRAVARTATEVSRLDLGGDDPALDARVPADLSTPGTEVGDVGAAVNTMLEHVDRALHDRHESEQRMRRFVADASHELRTPLATIRGYADLTRPVRDTLPATVVTSLERIDQGTVRMSGLVDDLLLLARLDAGREEFVPTDVDMSALLIELVEDAHVTERATADGVGGSTAGGTGEDGRSESAGHRWELDLPEEPVVVRGVEGRIRQVIGNVLTNARVHTPNGTHVRVGLRVADGTGKVEVGETGTGGSGIGESAIVRVEDDGPGIPAEVRTRVFERFVTAGSGRSRSASAQSSGGSSGLGMAIAHALMEYMGGEITVASPVLGDVGTAFEVRLPLADG